MGFANVAWESRDTEQLARDLTEGPGPAAPGQAGASWVRVANELALVAGEYDAIALRLKESFSSQSGESAVRKIEEFSRWLQALSLSAAGNGQRAEEFAVAHGVAVLAMPTVAEAVEAQASREVMASLAAYNGQILNGRFAEFDDAATADQANAAAVMYRYEEACAAMAVPWEQPLPPDIVGGRALQAERDATVAAEGSPAGDGSSGVGTAAVPTPLAAFRHAEVKSSSESSAVRAAAGSVSGGSAGGMGGMGGGYAPMAAAARNDNHSEHQSGFTAGSLAGGGESGTSLSADGGGWLPTTTRGDLPQLMAQVSWGPNESAFVDNAGSETVDTTAHSDEQLPPLEHVSQQWVAPAVIGVDKDGRS